MQLSLDSKSEIDKIYVKVKVVYIVGCIGFMILMTTTQLHHHSSKAALGKA